MRSQTLRLALLALLVATGTSTGYLAGQPAGEGPNLARVRVTQQQIEDQEVSLSQIRVAGLRIFTTPFNKLDGYGDGPMDLNDTVDPGGRPTLQGNGTLLRVNGLDAQTCLECHSVLSAATVPQRLGIGGAGGSATNAMIRPTAIDPADLENFDETAGFNGRFANPPFVFGSGAVELLGLEMTDDLQALRAQALAQPGTVIPLTTHGVSFGTIFADAFGNLDLSGVHGVDSDLVVKPFGRKGEFPTVRDFDIGAMQFHHGMQPTEVVGEGNDADGDGVPNEILPGDLSALQTFEVTLERPRADPLHGAAARGFRHFQQAGCASCHIPALQTRSKVLPLRYPPDPIDHTRGVYLKVDLSRPPVSFATDDEGGITVPLFADLKRHDMGPGLAETFALVDEQRNREFTTARLWGVADTAPYLHDGRATTLTEAILLHGGEAQAARDAFAALGYAARTELLEFLRTLHTPHRPASDLLDRDGPRHPDPDPRHDR